MPSIQIFQYNQLKYLLFQFRLIFLEIENTEVLFRNERAGEKL